ncbi:Mov34/MPN/PAD-1 family protein [uncultured Endozoicomonas sp.]|uniref:Mov34/MPN/PAD-1 family protein n=1 Tax=uncultured Endozoicomonas sp. TaxID=432652 RepID=UPI00344147F2
MRDLAFYNLKSPHMVLMSSDVLAFFQSHCQVEGPESGGLMLGYWRDPHLEIIKCTAPMPEDKQSRFSFLRKDRHHMMLAQALHNSSQQKICYLGEWHTHPEEIPSPSLTDCREWKVIQSKYNRPLSFVIVGRGRLYVQVRNSCLLLEE